MKSLRDHYQKLLPYVVSIVKDINNESGNNRFHVKGSGLLIHKSGFVLTAAHVVDFNENLSACNYKGADNKKSVYVSAAKSLQVFKINDLDVAILNLGLKDADGFKTEDFTTDICEGDLVFTCGFPLRSQSNVNMKPNLFTGVISSIKHDGKATLDISIHPGVSGGPVFNYDGKLIGVINSQMLRATNKRNDEQKLVPNPETMTWTNLTEFTPIGLFGDLLNDLISGKTTPQVRP